MQECLFSEPPRLEREPSWKPHQEVMPTTHSPTLLPPTLYLFLVNPHDFVPFSIVPHPRCLLRWWENGEGVGDFPHPDILSVDTWIFKARKEALQDRILIFYEREITTYACMGNG